jgi:phage shock protein A
MSEHEQQADRLEAEADKLQQHSERLGEDIDETREQWHQRQADASVPGATGEPPSDEELPPPDPYETD